MANHNHSFFYTALVITALIHILAISPIASWLSREILPSFSDESIEIDLAEIKARSAKSQHSQIIAKNTPEPSIPDTPKIDRPEQDKERFLNPEEKKVLDPTLTEDRILAPDQKQGPAPPDQSPRRQETAPLPLDPKEKEEEIVSPLFIQKPKTQEATEPTPKKEKSIPPQIKETLRDGKPEKTDEEDLEFSMNSYKWTFQRYMENWAVDIQKWWKPPLDYAMGNVPEGGDMWIQVKLGKTGRLLGYRILGSEVTAEMELMVIQALVGSLARPSLPEAFPEDWLLINWHFIYPPIRPQLDMRR